MERFPSSFIIECQSGFRRNVEIQSRWYSKILFDWCKSKQISLELPFPLGVVSLYLFEVQQSCSSSSSVILTHAALKWLHLFVPSLDCNPLESDFCRNIVESAKRQRSQSIMKRSPLPQKSLGSNWTLITRKILI